MTSAVDIPVEPIDNLPTLVYWDICGLAQPIRLVLECTGVDYVDVRIDPGMPGTASYKQEWFARKKDLSSSGCRFANLPYFLDNDCKMAQSNAILTHLGRKFGLLGPDPDAIDLVLAQTTDFDSVLTGACYRDFPAVKQYIQTKLASALDDWRLFLSGKSFMTGEAITVADLKIYETLRKVKIFEAHFQTAIFLAFPTLQDFLDRVESHPPIAAYLKGAAYLARPLNNPHAQFR